MLPLYFLSILLSDDLLADRQVSLVGTPVVGEETGYPEWLQKLPQPQESSVLAVAKYIGKNTSSLVVNCVPKPPLVALVTDITPHLVQFC